MRRQTVTLLAVVLICLGSLAWGEAAKKPSPVYLEVDFRVDEPEYFAGGPMPFALRLRLVPGVQSVSVPSNWYKGARVGWAPTGAGDHRGIKISPQITKATTGRQDKTVVLTPEKSGDSVYLVIPPDDTDGLASGGYVLQVTVNVPGVTRGPIEHEAEFTVMAATSVEEKSRLVLMTATYQVENENDLEGAIETVENGLRETGDAGLNNRLGWLYESQGDLTKAIAAYGDYVTWARASGIPRHDTRRGPQEIADDLEAVIAILQERVDNPAASQ